MIHLTADQYDVFYLAASNLLFHASNRDKAVDFADHLMAYTAILTCKYSDKDTFDEALAKAQELPDSRKSADTLIELFIGRFSYDESNAWRETKIPEAELKALMEQ